MDRIRVGMIRCDTHAAWYGLLFQPCDELLMLKHWPQCQYYFYYRHKLKFDTIDGFELVKVWDQHPRHEGVTYDPLDPRSNAEVFSDVFLGKPQVCERVEEVSDDVDLVFIPDCLWNGEDHRRLAEPGLRKGVPTFVDKPFAYTLADARAMVDLAREHDTPLMSASLLRVNPMIEQFRQRFDEIAPAGMGVVKGVGPGLNGVIHGLSLAQHVFGEGVEWVECMGAEPLEYIHLHYPRHDLPLPPNVEGVEVLVISSRLSGPNCGYRCEAYSSTGAIHSPWINDYNFPLGGQVVMRKLKDMVRTGRPPIPYDSMLELIEIVEAARLSHKTGKPVSLDELREG